MKIRGVRGGVLLSLDERDSGDTLNLALEAQKALLSGKVFLEIQGNISWRSLQHLQHYVERQGGEVLELRPPEAPKEHKRETTIIARTVRGGGRIEASGSVIILGDVNAGAEILAEDDVIVVGTLRGLAHAGVRGNREAIIWAQHIGAPQLRIADCLAQAGETPRSYQGAEVAYLIEGSIAVRPWNVKHPSRS